MPSLVLGPLLRYVGETEAVLWVETDSPCEVEILGTRERTFCVCDHHYALVCCDGLEPGSWHEYEVTLDGERVWPQDDGFPASAFHTYPKEEPLQIAFGSCRVAAPHEPPYSLRKDEDARGREIDALRTLALRMRDEPREHWPDVLLMIGDQVYADEVSPGTQAFIETRRDPAEPPGERVLDFEDYTRLYLESWSEPAIRWLLSTVSTAMIFDDHDVHDDWNISQAWLEEMRKHEWWNEHIKAALASYWVYQHLGNLSPDSHQEDELLKRVKEADDAEDLLEAFAFKADRETSGMRWSYCRDLGNTRLVVIDSRAGRMLEEGRRSMLDPDEWDWVHRARHGRLRPPARGHIAALAARARHALPRGLERGGGGRRLGRRGRGGGREPAPGGGHGALGRVPGVVRPAGRAVQGGRGGRARRAAGVDRDPLRRRPPRLPVRGRLPARHGDEVERLAGGLLALPQSAREEASARASGSACRVHSRSRCARSPGSPGCATRASAGG